jgi:signal peptidase I
VARTKEKSTAGSLIELVMIVAVALGLALGIQAFLVKPFRIPSESMVPTLEIGQRVLVDRVSKNFRRRGPTPIPAA